MFCLWKLNYWCPDASFGTHIVMLEVDIWHLSYVIDWQKWQMTTMTEQMTKRNRKHSRWGVGWGVWSSGPQLSEVECCGVHWGWMKWGGMSADFFLCYFEISFVFAGMCGVRSGWGLVSPISFFWLCIARAQCPLLCIFIWMAVLIFGTP